MKRGTFEARFLHLQPHNWVSDRGSGNCRVLIGVGQYLGSIWCLYFIYTCRTFARLVSFLSQLVSELQGYFMREMWGGKSRSMRTFSPSFLCFISRWDQELWRHVPSWNVPCLSNFSQYADIVESWINTEKNIPCLCWGWKFPCSSQIPPY